MIKSISKMALVAGFGLALVFIFGCSSDDSGGGGDNSGNVPLSSSEAIFSSPSAAVSSSSFGLELGSSSSVVYSSSGVVFSSSSISLSSSSSIQSGVVLDPSVNYGGETYQTVVIGSQIWFQRNLNYDVQGSVCYDNDPANCTKYGRLYDWATAMALSPSCDSISCAGQLKPKHQGICPSGWHIPSNADWNELMRYVDGESWTAGGKLKAKSGWNEGGNGTDEFGFSALPGGYGYSGGYFYVVGNIGRWWSSSEYLSYYAYYWRMYYIGESASLDHDGKLFLYSVRCVQD